MAQPSPVPSTRRAAGDGADSRVGLYVGAGLAVLVILVVAVATSGRGPQTAPPEPEHAGPAIQPPPEHRPSPLEIAEERLRELEAFATPAADPQAILARCDQARPIFRGSPLEPRLNQIEAKARERLKQRERDAELDRSLAAIRKIIAEDPGCRRRAEVDRLLDRALKEAGPRTVEVQKLQSEYRTLCEDDAKRKKAASRNWTELFVEATKKIQANDYPGAKALYLEGLATLPGKRPEDLQQRAIYCIGLYNLACIYSVESAKLADKARSQAVDDALRSLGMALRADYGRFRCACHPQTYGIGHMADDRDMDPIRKDARYVDLIKQYK